MFTVSHLYGAIYFFKFRTIAPNVHILGKAQIWV